MLKLLDELLRKLLMEGVAQLRPVPVGSPQTSVIESQVNFGPPDDKWRAFVSGLDPNRNALNVYLVDLRENRKLRTNEHERRIDSGIVYDNPAPMRIDCHYLISAWSPSENNLTPSVEPIFDEHILLYQTVAVLTNAMPFIPAKIYPASSTALNAWPQRFQNVDLPATITQPEGFQKLAEFWGAMGMGHRWKPAVYLIVTIPVELTEEVAGPMVTTRITEYRQAGKPETAEVWIQIGGTVFDNTNVPVANAWVQLETTANEPLQTTETNTKGRFTFSDLRSGQYKLHARAAGKDRVKPVEVPSPTGEYDVKFL